MTHTQASLIIALLAAIAFCVGTFLLQDWYYSLRAWMQQRAIKQERLAREYQEQLDFERRVRRDPPPKVCSVCLAPAAYLMLAGGEYRCYRCSVSPTGEKGNPE